MTAAQNRFDERLKAHGVELRRGALETLQINIGRKCNQACRHCHVAAAPWRTEMLSADVARRIAEWITEYRPSIVDITGGAPELSEHFRFLVEVSRAAGARVMDRCNLTIIEEAGFESLPEFLARHEVEVVASLPCYLEENVNRQRGNHVFDRSIRALKKLNAVGYGSELPLHLVYNPLGPKLPPPQAELEADYREVLGREYGIRFTGLFTLTNQPIARFADDLREQGRLEEYLELLRTSFNAATLTGVMCRNSLSVDYEGRCFDCDFNQMLNLAPLNPVTRWLWDVTPESLIGQEIATGDHCLACTAGCGSSCTGAVQVAVAT